jgi:hypothetical protein
MRNCVKLKITEGGIFVYGVDPSYLLFAATVIGHSRQEIISPETTTPDTKV